MILFENIWYKWYVDRVRVSRWFHKELAPYYSQSNQNSFKCNSFVVNIFDGKVQAGGLADRLRGILSTYYVCKKLGHDFRLYFVFPFNLENYLVPNIYDWRCEQKELCFNKNYTDVLTLFTTNSSSHQRKKQKQWLHKKISRSHKQCHVYTNALFCYDYDYRQLFFELFKPSVPLQHTLDEYAMILGETYISVSCRFLDLLDDFNETQAIKASLSKIEKSALIDKVINEIVSLHAKFPNVTILCNSDSVTFLNEVKKLEYTYVVPGEITHIDGKTNRDDYKIYEKTFVDFFLIAKASHIYLLKTGRMHTSGFPYAASKLYGRPFDTIVF